jgi:hypothetical protein
MPFYSNLASADHYRIPHDTSTLAKHPSRPPCGTRKRLSRLDLHQIALPSQLIPRVARALSEPMHTALDVVYLACSAFLPLLEKPRGVVCYYCGYSETLLLTASISTPTFFHLVTRA